VRWKTVCGCEPVAAVLVLKVLRTSVLTGARKTDEPEVTLRDVGDVFLGGKSKSPFRNSDAGQRYLLHIPHILLTRAQLTLHKQNGSQSHRALSGKAVSDRAAFAQPARRPTRFSVTHCTTRPKHETGLVVLPARPYLTQLSPCCKTTALNYTIVFKHSDKS